MNTDEALDPVRPGEFSRYLLRALEAADGGIRRRKRDQKPDAIGLAIKREILQRAADEDPAADEFEAWLVRQVLAAPAGGPVRAMCFQILDEYRVANADPGLSRWLQAGAPSEDAAPGRVRSDEEVQAGARMAGLYTERGWISQQ